jgi:hypothetical protein
MANHPVIHRIQRYRQHDAPDYDADEWANQDKRQVHQEAESPEPDRQFDPGRG